MFLGHWGAANGGEVCAITLIYNPFNTIKLNSITLNSETLNSETLNSETLNSITLNSETLEASAMPTNAPPKPLSPQRRAPKHALTHTERTRNMLTLAMVATTLPAPIVCAQEIVELPHSQVSTQSEENYKVDTSTSHKNTQPLLDTAKTITVIPQSVMQDRGVDSLRDALRNVPGISLAAGEGGAGGRGLATLSQADPPVLTGAQLLTARNTAHEQAGQQPPG